MVHYPTDFPSDAARQIIQAWQQGQLSNQKPEIAESVWNLQGYGMGCLLGFTNAPPLSQAYPHAADDCPTDTDSIVKILEAHENLPADQKQNIQEGRVVGSLIPLPPAALVKWALQLLLTFL